jgi:hypothetical protein
MSSDRLIRADKVEAGLSNMIQYGKHTRVLEPQNGSGLVPVGSRVLNITES